MNPADAASSRVGAALRDPESTVLGCWCTLGDPVAAEVLASAGFDLVVVDLQHGSITWSELPSVLQAIQLGGAEAFVRTSWNDPQQLMKALDLGARGVIVPMVDTADDARQAAAAVRYPPDGNRSFGQTRRAYASVEQANAEVVCLPMIETAAGLRNVDAIAAVPGVDGLFVGPIDLGLALGVGLDLTMASEAVLAGLDAAVAATRATGGVVGTLSADADGAARAARAGVRLLTVGSDKGHLRAGASAAAARLRSALG